MDVDFVHFFQLFQRFRFFDALPDTFYQSTSQMVTEVLPVYFSIFRLI